jgi:hypothetical protein
MGCGVGRLDVEGLRWGWCLVRPTESVDGSVARRLVFFVRGCRTGF